MSELMPVVNEFSHELNDRGFAVNRGWNDELANALIMKSREDQMLQAVPRDASERFADVVSAEAWYTRTDRLVYSLGETATLSGLIWFGYSPRPELHADYTFAIRLYENARGAKLSLPFMRAAHADFHHARSSAVWLETDRDNDVAKNLYIKFGYEVMATDDRIVMTYRDRQNN